MRSGPSMAMDGSRWTFAGVPYLSTGTQSNQKTSAHMVHHIGAWLTIEGVREIRP